MVGTRVGRAVATDVVGISIALPYRLDAGSTCVGPWTFDLESEITNRP